MQLEEALDVGVDVAALDNRHEHARDRVDGEDDVAERDALANALAQPLDDVARVREDDYAALHREEAHAREAADVGQDLRDDGDLRHLVVHAAGLGVAVSAEANGAAVLGDVRRVGELVDYTLHERRLLLRRAGPTRERRHDGRGGAAAAEVMASSDGGEARDHE